MDKKNSHGLSKISSLFKSKLEKHSSSKFHYPPLRPSRQEIRLLTLHPGDFNSPIYVSLSKVSLKDVPIYEGISYVCGDPTNKRPIFLDGTETLILTNLESALRHVRLQDQDRLLWADAICINQLDLVEKNQQVAFMGEIYRNCMRCVVFLGVQDEEYSEEVFRYLEKVAIGGHFNPPPCDNMVGSYRCMNKMAALKKMMTLPWWNRTWCVQESVLPLKLEYYWGKRKIDGKIVHDARDHLDLHWLQRGCCGMPKDACGECDSALTLFQRDMTIWAGPYHYERLDEDGMAQPHSAITSSELVNHMIQQRGRRCQDPSDKVYAFLSLASNRWRDEIDIDYKKSFKTLYMEVVRVDAIISKSLRILGLVTHNHLSTSNLPSWVPDWSISEHFGFDYAQLKRYNLFSACKSPTAPIDRSQFAHGVLRLSTISFCIIEVAGPSLLDVADEETKTKPIYQEWDKMFSSYMTSKSAKGIRKENTSTMLNQGSSRSDASLSYVFGGTSSNAFARTIAFDHFSALGQQEDTVRAGPNHEKLFWPVWNVLIGKQEYVVPSKSKSEDVLLGIVECTTSQAFFITQQGYFGLGPGRLKAGDEIHIAAGGRCPLVLRKINVQVEKWKGKVKGSFYTLVGDCYIHGIMDGEAAEKFEERAVNVNIV